MRSLSPGACWGSLVQALPQVKDVSVNLESKLAKVEVEASQPEALGLLAKLVDTVNGLGFEAQAVTNSA